MFNAHRVSVGEDEKVLEIDEDNDCNDNFNVLYAAELYTSKWLRW